MRLFIIGASVVRDIRAIAPCLQRRSAFDSRLLFLPCWSAKSTVVLQVKCWSISFLWSKEVQQAAKIVIAEPTRVRATHPMTARVVGHSDLVRPRKDAAADLEQQEKLQVLRKFFADRSVQVDLPPKN